MRGLDRYDKMIVVEQEKHYVLQKKAKDLEIELHQLKAEKNPQQRHIFTRYTTKEISVCFCTHKTKKSRSYMRCKVKTGTTSHLSISLKIHDLLKKKE
jgi:hypothetical protein